MLDETLLSIITDLGDAGFLLPMSILLGLTLLLSGDRRSALAFVVSLAICVAATVMAKVAFMTCAGERAGAAIYSPSGHASLAALFFPALALVGGRNGSRLYKGAFVLACALIVLLIAGSRVVLGVHTLAETAAGVAIGLGSFGFFWRFASPHGAIFAPAFIAALSLLAVAYAIFGSHVGIEHWLELVAGWLSSFFAC